MGGIVRLRTLGVLALVMAGLGCDVVQESEIIRSSEFFLDECSADAIRIEPGDTINRISFAGVRNDSTASAASCGLSGLKGGDGVFMFESPLEANWRIVASADDPEVDIALYINDACDVGSCRAARDRCGAGGQEAMSFFANAKGNVDTENFDALLFSLVVDTKRPFTGVVDVTLSRPVCGSGEVELGEGCDDDNLINGDGCSRDCLVELDFATDGAVAAGEVEPNDAAQFANTLVIDTTVVDRPVTIAGQAPACDDDVFLLPAGVDTLVSATVESQNPMRVRLLTVDRVGNVIAVASPADNTTVTVEQTLDDPVGDYFLEVRAAADMAAGANDYSATIQYAAKPQEG